MKITDYKGCEIYYESSMKLFRVEEKQFPTQTEAETYIDRLVKAEKATFKRIPVIYSDGGWGRYLTGEVTSMLDDEAWVVSSEGKRTKTRTKYIFHTTPENQARIGRLIDINKQIEDLQAERDSIKFDCPLSEGV